MAVVLGAGGIRLLAILVSDFDPPYIVLYTSLLCMVCSSLLDAVNVIAHPLILPVSKHTT